MYWKIRSLQRTFHNICVYRTTLSVVSIFALQFTIEHGKNEEQRTRRQSVEEKKKKIKK